MGPDPEPHDVLALPDTERPVPQADADRENGAMRVNLLELKARMEWIGPEGAVGSSGSALDVRWQPPKRLPEACVRVRVHILSGSIGSVRPAR
jgi:hypothetical protein